MPRLGEQLANAAREAASTRSPVRPTAVVSAVAAAAGAMIHGWIILDKPVGLGSTQAVGAVKRLLREAGEPKTKVGHGGTLDPFATGLLLVLVGRATRAQRFSAAGAAALASGSAKPM